jgi:hypothetical protein
LWPKAWGRASAAAASAHANTAATLDLLSVCNTVNHRNHHGQGQVQFIEASFHLNTTAQHRTIAEAATPDAFHRTENRCGSSDGCRR